MYAAQGAWAMSPAASAQAGGRATDIAASNNGSNNRLGQLRAQYEWQLRTKTEETREMQTRLTQVEVETAQAEAAWESERKSLMRQIAQYRMVLERYCIPLDEAGPSNYDGGEGAAAAYYRAYETQGWDMTGGGG